MARVGGGPSLRSAGAQVILQEEDDPGPGGNETALTFLLRWITAQELAERGPARRWRRRALPRLRRQTSAVTGRPPPGTAAAEAVIGSVCGRN